MTATMLTPACLASVLDHPLSQSLAAALLHFVWQGALLSVLLAVALRTRVGATPQRRYVAAMTTLSLMALCPALTLTIGGVASNSEPQSSRHSPSAVHPNVESGMTQAAGARSVSATSVGNRHAGGVVADSTRSLPATLADADRGFVAALTSLRIPDAWKPNLVVIWLAGVTALGARLLLGWCGQLWLGGDRRRLPDRLAKHADLLASRLGVGGGRVFVSTRIVEAVAIGFVRPMVLIPAAWVSGLSSSALEAVIAHELAHVRRWDLWANLFQRLIETVLFYHPAVWWVSHRASMDRELCCDELAVAATGRRLDYARALEAIAATRVAVASGGTLALAFGGRTNMKVLTRVQNVLGMSARSRSGLVWPACAVALALPIGLSIATTGPANAADNAAALVDGERPREGAPPVREGERPKEGERPREGDRPREGGDRPREGAPRDGDRPREGGDRPREGAPPLRDGDRPREGAPRDGDRPREGGDRPREDGDRPREGTPLRDAERPREGAPRDGDRPREGGDRPREGGDRPRDGESAREAKPALNADAERKALRVFEAYDENKNGFVSFPEWLDMRSGAAENAARAGAERERFNSFDRNRDGNLSFEEFVVSRGEPQPPVRRDGDRPREGEVRRDGEGAPRPREGEIRRDGDRPREGEIRRDGEGAPRPREGEIRRDGDRPREGEIRRDGEGAPRPREGEIRRDGERPREGEAVKRAPRDGEVPR